MKNNYFKVNRRYVFLYLLIAFVVFGIIAYVPRIRAEGLSDIFGAIIPPGAAPGDYNTGWGTTPTPPTYPYPPFPTTTPVSVLTGTPAPIPAGDCMTGLNRALQNLDAVSSQVLPVYQQASSQTGIPWEIFASIHYIETGGSFNPNGSLISGRPIGAVEPDQGNKVYHTLLESAIDAGSVFKSKYGSQVGPFNNFQQLVTAFAGYNGTGNRQCNGFVPKPQSQYTGCPAYYPNEDHLYPLACYDERHKDMWYIYCSDGQVCPPIGGSNPGIKYSPNKIGALTLIAGIQARNQPTPTVPITITPPSGSLRYFNQCDPAYQAPALGTCPKGNTQIGLLCRAGCGPTTTAEIIASYADGSYTPVTAATNMFNQGQLSCAGSGIMNLVALLDAYPSIEHSGYYRPNGDLANDALVLKPFLDQGWTALAREGYVRTEGTPPNEVTITSGHFIWVTSIDANNDIWAYDVYWVNPLTMPTNPAPPINISGLLRGEYAYKGFRSIDITNYVLVRKRT